MVCMPSSSTEHVDELQPLMLFSDLQQACAEEVYDALHSIANIFLGGRASNHAPIGLPAA